MGGLKIQHTILLGVTQSGILIIVGVLFVGTDEGKVWGTRDGGATRKDLSKGLAKERWVTRVVASVHDEGTVWVSQSGYRNDDFAPYLDEIVTRLRERAHEIMVYLGLAPHARRLASVSRIQARFRIYLRYFASQPSTSL